MRNHLFDTRRMAAAAGTATLATLLTTVTPRAGAAETNPDAGARTRSAASRVASSPASSPFTGYRQQSPGRVHLIQVKDLPPPHATPSVDSGRRRIPRPKDAWPQAPAGFKVQLFAEGLENPRLIRTAPNGDVFVAESEEGFLRVFRGVTADGRAIQSEKFAEGLRQPFGMAFYPPGPDPQWLYVANTDSVVRFAYRKGDLKARPNKEGKREGEKVTEGLPAGGRLRGGGHWTRDIAFSRDGKKMYISVGSQTNVDDPEETPAERNRAAILEFNPDGSGGRIFASGIRNPVGLAISPRTGVLWTSVNERDGLGDNLVPDYITRVKEGEFFGWPWFYMGGNQDPRHKGKHPELKDKVVTPDVLLQPHNASLQLTFYDGEQFPAEYRGDIFAAQHGSWNREARTGYEVVRVPLHQADRPSGGYQDFLTGFVTAKGEVWGRPVGVTVAEDGALLVSDDGSNSIWRVSHAGPKRRPPQKPPR